MTVVKYSCWFLYCQLTSKWTAIRNHPFSKYLLYSFCCSYLWFFLFTTLFYCQGKFILFFVIVCAFWYWWRKLLLSSRTKWTTVAKSTTIWNSLNVQNVFLKQTTIDIEREYCDYLASNTMRQWRYNWRAIRSKCIGISYYKYLTKQKTFIKNETLQKKTVLTANARHDIN